MAEPKIKHSIPSKQRHYSGTLRALAENLLTREIGFCTEDNRCYGKIIDSTRPEDLIPLGGKGYVDPPPTDQLSLLLGMPNGSNDWVRLTTKRIGSGSTQSEDMWYELDGCKFAAQRAEKNAQGRDIQAKLEGSPGVEVDQDNCVVRLTERSTFQPSRGDLIKGALQIIEGSSATRYQVRIGQSEALGALIPIVGPGKHGWVLRSNDSAGKVEWVKPADLFSSDGSIKISDNGTDPLTAALSIERVSTEKLEGYIRAENLEDNSIPAEKLEIRKKLMVDGTTIGATESLNDVVLHSIYTGDLGVLQAVNTAYTSADPSVQNLNIAEGKAYNIYMDTSGQGVAVELTLNTLSEHTIHTILKVTALYPSSNYASLQLVWLDEMLQPHMVELQWGSELTEQTTYYLDVFIRKIGANCVARVVVMPNDFRKNY